MSRAELKIVVTEGGGRGSGRAVTRRLAGDDRCPTLPHRELADDYRARTSDTARRGADTDDLQRELADTRQEH